MRFAHKKIPKTWLICTFCLPDPVANLCSAFPPPLGQTIRVITRLHKTRKFTALLAGAGHASRPIRQPCAKV